MDLIRYSIEWVRGEILEMTLIAVAGATLVGVLLDRDQRGVAFLSMASGFSGGMPYFSK